MAGKNTMRLDRLLTMLGEGTRAQVKDLVRAGRVSVDGMPVRDSGMQVDVENARVCIGGRVLEYKAVNGAGRNQTAAVPHCCQRGDLIDPLHQSAAKQSVLTVDILGLHDFRALCHGVCCFFILGFLIHIPDTPYRFGFFSYDTRITFLCLSKTFDRLRKFNYPETIQNSKHL